MKKIIYLLLLLLFLSVGFFVGDNRARVENKLNKLFVDQTETVVASAFVGLALKKYKVEVAREGNGGGITSVRNDVLLLTHEGSFFLSNQAGLKKKLAISPPDNGYLDYVEMAKTSALDGLRHDFSSFRYNDVLYYEQSGKGSLVVSYTYFDKDNVCYSNAVSRLSLAINKIPVIENVSANADDWQLLYQSQPCLPLKDKYRAIEGHMAGGRIAFQAPSTLWLTSGDYHWDGVYADKAIAQSPDYDYGKVISINLDSAAHRVVASGLRNMQGIVVDNRGQVWTAEHGVSGGDELNLIYDGGNFGWPLETLGTQYGGLPIPGTLSFGRHDQFQAPSYSWLPSVGLSNVTFVDGFHPTWDGDLLAASLSGKSLFRLRVDNKVVIYSEPIVLGYRIRYVHQHTDGRLVLWTDDKHLIFIQAQENGNLFAFIDRYLEKNNIPVEKAEGVRAVVSACLECHSFESGDNVKSPSLSSVYGSDIASKDYKFYSTALKSVGGKWNRDNLVEFLSSPQQFSPGSTMPPQNISDKEQINLLIDLLIAFQENPI